MEVNRKIIILLSLSCSIANAFLIGNHLPGLKLTALRKDPGLINRDPPIATNFQPNGRRVLLADGYRTSQIRGHTVKMSSSSRDPGNMIFSEHSTVSGGQVQVWEADLNKNGNPSGMKVFDHTFLDKNKTSNMYGRQGMKVAQAMQIYRTCPHLAMLYL
jgi:hypothetical protein